MAPPYNLDRLARFLSRHHKSLRDRKQVFKALKKSLQNRLPFDFLSRSGLLCKAISAARKSTPQAISWIERLPDELLCMVTEHLEPAEAVVLGLTCSTMFIKVDFRLLDILEACYLDLVMNDDQASATLHAQRYIVLDRLHHDRLGRLIEQTEGPTPHLICSVCLKLHPADFFSREEQDMPPFWRQCLASTQAVRICKHWSEDFVSLQAMHRSFRCNAEAYPASRHKRCTSTAHGPYSFRGSSPDLGLLGRLSISQEYHLLNLPRTAEHNKHEIRRSVSLQKNVEVCLHVKLGDEIVWQSLEAALAGLKSFDDIMGTCPRCKAIWTFSLSGRRFEGQSYYSLAFGTFRTIELRDPWGDTYLSMVPGGLEMKAKVFRDCGISSAGQAKKPRTPYCSSRLSNSATGRCYESPSGAAGKETTEEEIDTWLANEYGFRHIAGGDKNRCEDEGSGTNSPDKAGESADDWLVESYGFQPL